MTFGLKMTPKEWREWLVFLAGDVANVRCSYKCMCEFCERMERSDVEHATNCGQRIPRSLRHHVQHPSWSIDPNYIKLRRHVREGRRIADAWERQRGTVKIWVEKEKQ